MSTSDWKFLATRTKGAAAGHRPHMFRPQDSRDAEALRRLVRDEPGLEVLDSIAGQLADLVRSRRPSRRLSDAEVSQLVEAHLNGVRREAYGVWVYYPWSRRLVHLLDEAEFVELRTNRNQHKITAEEQRTLATRRIGIIGLSVGQSVALTLALERSAGELRIADADRLELSNLNRIRTGLHNLDLPKVCATAREIAEIDPFLKVTCFPAGITADNIEEFLLEGGKLDLLIEECDSLDIKVLARIRARAHRIPVVMDTSDRGLIDVERFDLEPERPLFHGRAGDLSPERLRGLSPEEKVPFVMQIVGHDTISPRMRASLLEVEQTLKTWPQLASSVVHGGAAAADAARRIVLGQPVRSGRYYVDLEQLIGGAPPEPARDAEPVGEILCGVSAASLDRPLAASPSAIDLGAERLARLVEAGTAAPSGGNSQPWLWVYQDRCLGLFHDRARSDSLADFEAAGGVVALGAAAENVVLAAHREGLYVRVAPFPREGDADLAATFEFFEAPVPGVEARPAGELWQAIGLRHTNRRRSERARLPPDDVEALRAAVRSVPGADLLVLESDAALQEIAALMGAADRARLLTQALHRDMMEEIRWTEAEANARRDGLFVGTLELSPADLAGLTLCRDWASLELLRRWGAGRGLEKMAEKALAGASAVALVTMPRAGQVDYFHGGRAVERAWLTATLRGIAVYPMTTLPYLFARFLRGGAAGMEPELAETTRRLRSRYVELFDVTDTTAEILLVRLSPARLAGAPSVRSLRRPLDEILLVR